MDIEEVKQQLNDVDYLGNTLGIVYHSTPDPHTCEATLKVTAAVGQPLGFLNGGTSLAMAENLAGVGSASLCQQGQFPMGTNVTAHHLTAVPVGETVKAVARILHQGRTLHVWNVDILNEKGEIASTARVTNYIISPGVEK